MVEENFKIGIHLELEQSSLADIQKQIEKTIQEATQRAMKGATGGSTGPAAGAIKSAKGASGVTGGDFAKSIQQVMHSELKTFESAANQITDALQTLTTALNKGQRAAKTADTAPPPSKVSSNAVKPADRTAAPAPKEKVRSTGMTGRIEGQEKAAAAAVKIARALESKIKAGDKSPATASSFEKAQAKIKKIIEQPQRLLENQTKARNKALAKATADQVKSAQSQVKADENLITAANELADAQSAAAKRTRFLARKEERMARLGGVSVSAPQQAQTRDPRQTIKSQPAAGATNTNIKTDRNIRSQTGGRTEPASLTTQPTSSTTGVPRVDSKGVQQEKSKKDAAKNLPPRGAHGRVDWQQQAEKTAQQVADTLTQFGEDIQKAMPNLFKGKDLRSTLGLPSAEDVRVAPGAVPTIKSPEGSERQIGTIIQMQGDVMKRTNHVARGMEGIAAELAQVATKAGRDPERATQMLRTLIRKRVIGDAQKYEKHQSMGQFMRGGEAQLEWEPSASQLKKIQSATGDAEKLGVISTMLHEMSRASGKFVSAGADVVTMMGLTEEAAAAMAGSLDKNRFEATGQIRGKVQTRPVVEMQAGGTGLSKQVRGTFLKGAATLDKGEVPEIKSKLLSKLIEQGLVKGSSLNLKTAAISQKHLPEIHEDQMLMRASAAKRAGMTKEDKELVASVDEELTVGMGLQQGQRMGLDASGKEVEFNLKGAAATISEFKEVFINGRKMFQIVFDEVNAATTGSKFSTFPGSKSEMKVIPDKEMAAYGAGDDVDVITSTEGFIRRGDLQDIIAMISTSMADGGKVAAQVIFDNIVDAMKQTPDLEMGDAVKRVASEMNLDPNAAFKDTTGALKAGGIDKVLTGRLAWNRLEKEGQTGEAIERDRFIDPVAMKALEQRAETLSLAMAAQNKSHGFVTRAQEDYRKMLMSMSGAGASVTDGLKKMHPEDFQQLPSGFADPDQMKGTLADPEFQKEAFSMMVPKKAGGHEEFFVPGMGKAVGQRTSRTTEAGTIETNKLTKLLDKFRAQNLEIKGARGELSPGSSDVAHREAAEFVTARMNDQIKAVTTAGVESDEGQRLVSEFKSTFMPLVDKMTSMGMESGIQYRMKGRAKVQTNRQTPSKYVNVQKTKKDGTEVPTSDTASINRIRDVLGFRAENTASGSVASTGGLYKDLGLIEDAMSRVGQASVADSAYMDRQWKQQGQMRGAILKEVTSEGYGRSGTPAYEESRKVAQTRGSGIASAQYGKAIEFGVDMNSQIESAEKSLRAMAKAGKDVAEPMKALERMKSLQVSEDVIPRDAMLLSKKDYAQMKRLAKKQAKEMGMGNLSGEELDQVMARGMHLRDPVTGGASQQIVKIQEDTTGKLPEGKFGVAGTFAMSSTKDMQQIRKPFEDIRSSSIAVIKANGGVGDAADEARVALRAANEVLYEFTNSFHSATMNLDFDGDATKLFGAMTLESAKGMKTAKEIFLETGFSMQSAMRNIIGNIESPDQDYSSLKGVSDAFGAIAKRPAAWKKAVPMPDTAETEQIETLALTGGKLSVGLLSDAFNILYTAIVGGAKMGGDAFATASDYIMLNINESLAAKHGTGGTEGPLELTKALALGKGGMSNILSGMDAGADNIFGKMGKYNKDMRSEMEPMLRTQDPAKLTQMALEEGILKEGEQVEKTNYESVIQQLMDKMDLKGQLQRMQDMLFDNYRRALKDEGMSASAIENDIRQKTQRTKQNQGKKLEGINPRDVIPESYAMSRRKGTRAMEELDYQGRAKKILGTLFGQSEESLKGTTDFEMDSDGVRAAGKGIVDDLRSWIEGIKDLYGVVDDELLRGAGLDPRKVTGLYNEPPGTEPGEGAVMVSESNRMRPLEGALTALGRIDAGNLEATPKVINFIIDSIANMGKTLAHESIHQGSKVFREGVTEISTSLMDSSTDIGKAAPLIRKAANQLASVRGHGEKLQKLSALRRDRGEDAEVSGMGGLGEFAGANVSDAIAKQGVVYIESIAEELLAHLANPQRWVEIFGSIPEEVGMSLVKMFAQLEEETGGLATPILQRAQGLASGVLQSHGQSLQGVGTPEMTDAQEEAKRRINSATGFPGVGIFAKLSDELQLFSQALDEGRQHKDLRPSKYEDSRIGTGSKALELPGEGVVEGMQIPADSMRMMLNEMEQEGGVDPGRMGELRKNYQETAFGYKKAMQGVGESAGGGGRKASRAYLQAMQEFQAAELQMYINKGKGLQEAIAELQLAGKGDGPEIAEKLKHFHDAIQQMYLLLGQTKLPGTFKQTGLAMDPSGAMLPTAAEELRIQPGESAWQDIIRSSAGRDDSKKRFGDMGDVMMGVKDGIEAGMSKTRAWMALWKNLEESPENLVENLGKVAAILSKMASLMGTVTGPQSEQSEALKAMASMAQKAHKAYQELGTVPRTPEAHDRAAAGDKRIAAAKMGGKDLRTSYDEQRASIQAEADQWAKQLTSMHKQGFKPVGGARIAKEKTFPIVDPESNTVLEKMTMSARRMGDQYVVSLTNAGRSAKEFTGIMRNSLRRVVQWGFATGIVYGTIRAFREMVTVITEVETKVTALKKVMDTSVTNFEAMQDSASDFAQEFGIGIEDVLDGMVVYGQQGLKMNKIMERTRATMLAVNTTTLTSVQATEALTAAHKVFGESVSGSAEFVDAWAAVAARHAITAADLADAVKRSGAAAQVAGVGFEDFMGVVTAIGSVTRQSGKEVATSTKFMFRAMRRPTAQKELGKMGVQSMDAGGDFKPAMDILKNLAGTWDELTRAQQVNLAQAMAGIRHYNSFIVLMNNFDEALLASADAANSQGFAMRKNRLTMQTFSKNVTVLKESVKGLTLEFGKTGLPIATGAIKSVSKLIQLFGDLPPAIMKTSLTAVGMGLAFHKAADIIADTMDAFSDNNVSSTSARSATVGILSDTGKSIKKGWQGAAIGTSSKELTKFGRTAHLARRGVDSLGRGVLGVGIAIEGVITGFRGATVAARGFSAAMITTVGGAAIIAIGAALVYAYKSYQEATISAKEYEQSLEELTGKSEDAASSLRSQAVHAERLSLAYDKIGKAQEAMGNDAAMAAALDEGRFKGAATAAQTYSNMLAEIGNSIAQLDPSKVQGITDTGDYIVGIDSSFKAMTQSALDAQNAISTAFKTDVISKFAAEIKEPVKLLDKMKQGFLEMADKATGGIFEIDTDTSAIGKLRATRKEIQALSKTMNEQAKSGQYSLMNQEKMNELVARENEERQAVLATAGEIKRIFESIPQFGDLETAMASMGTDQQTQIGIAAEAGAFGRGATKESVITQFMAKQSGLGGILDYQNTQSSGLSANAFLERGISARSGSAAVTGTEEKPLFSKQLGIISQQAADRATDGVTTLFSSLEEGTGKAIWQFRDRAGNFSSVLATELEGIVAELEEGAVADHFITWTKKEVEAAGEHTRKIMTMQFTGAMAGVRIPTGGMPKLGPARESELTVEQQVMKSLPKEMQQLADIQSEMNQLTKEYGEDILKDVEGTYKRQASSGQALKVVTQEILALANKLQQEGFFLSVIGNYEKMQAQLNKTLKEAATAAKDYERAESNKNKFLKTSAGALKGMGPLPNVDLGKSFKELSGVEKLAVEVPEFAGLLRGIQSTTDKRNRDLDTLNKLEKEMANFETSVKDMAAAGDAMTGEQKSRLMSDKEKTPKSQIELIKGLNKLTDETLQIGNQQLEVQNQMLVALGELVTLTALPENQRGAEFNKILKGKSFDQQTSAYGQVMGPGSLNDLYKKVIGIVQTEEGKSKSIFNFEKDDTTGRKQMDDIVALMNGMKELTKMPEDEQWAGISVPLNKTTYGTDTEGFANLQQLEAELHKRMREFFSTSATATKAMTNEISKIVTPENQKKSDADKAEAEGEEVDRLRALSVDKEKAARTKYLKNQAKVVKGLEDANRALMANTPAARLARAARDFATTLKDMALEFKKSEAMVVNKKDSDLEGPMARVGQAGFRTSFENKRREIEEEYGGNRPLSLDAMRAKKKALKDVDFEEKEAKIQQEQGIETAELRRIQQQAERVRSALADVAFDPNQDEELRSKARSYFDTLGDELATSEQAEQKGRGKKLTFKGIPSLEGLSQYAEEISKTAGKRAKDASSASAVKNLQAGMKPTLDVANKQLVVMKDIAKALGAETTPAGTEDDSGTDATTPASRSATAPVTTPYSVPSSDSSGRMSNSELNAYKDYYNDRAPKKSAPTDYKNPNRIENWGAGSLDAGGPSGANQAGMGSAAAALLMLSRPHEQAKASVKVFNTALGKVVNTLEDAGDGVLMASTKLQTVSAKGRAQGWEVGDAVNSQEFRTTTGPDGRVRTQAGHVGSEGLPPELRGKGIVPDRTSRAALELQRKYGAQTLTSTDNPSPGMLDSYQRSAQDTGGKFKFREGAVVDKDLSYFKEGGAFEVDIPDKPPAIRGAGGLSGEQLRGDTAYQDAVNRMNNPLETDARNLRHPNQWAGPEEINASLKDARWDKGVGGEYAASVKNKPSKWAGVEAFDEEINVKARRAAEARLRESSAAAKSAKATKAAEIDSPWGPRDSEIGMVDPDEIASTERAYERSRAAFEKHQAAREAAKDPNAKKPGRIKKFFEDRHLYTTNEDPYAGKSSSTKSQKAAAAIDSSKAPTSRMDKMLGNSGKGLLKGLGIVGFAAEVTEALDIFGSAGLKEDATEEGDRLGSQALITALGLVAAAIGGLPVAIAAGVGIAAAAGSDAFLGTDIIGTGGRMVNQASGGSMTDIAKAGGDWLTGAYGNTTAGVNFGALTDASTGLESPEVAAHREFLRNRTHADETRTSAEINTVTAVAKKDPNALDLGAAPDDDVSHHQQFLRDRAAGLLPADATRTSGQINQTSRDSLALPGHEAALDPLTGSSLNARPQPSSIFANPYAQVPAAAPKTAATAVSATTTGTATTPATPAGPVDPKSTREYWQNKMREDMGLKDYAEVGERPKEFMNAGMLKDMGSTPELAPSKLKVADRSQKMTDAENMRSMIGALDAGETYYTRPSELKDGQESLISSTELAGGNRNSGTTVDLNAAMSRMQQRRNPAVGNSGENAETERLTRQRGDATASTSALVVKGNGTVPGSTDSTDRASREGAGTAGGSSEAISALNESISTLNEAIGGLASKGITLPDTFSTSIAGIGTTISEQFTKPLKVTVDNNSLDVNVTNVDDIASKTATATAGALAADITILGTRIDAVEGITATDGTLNQSITTLYNELDQRIVENTTLNAAQEAQMTDFAVKAAAIDPAAVSALDTRTSAVENSVTELDTRVTTTESEVTTLKSQRLANTTSISSLVGEVAGLTTQGAATEQTAIAASLNADNATLAATTATTTAAAATVSAETATAAVGTLTLGLTDLSDKVEDNRQKAERDVQQVRTEISIIETDRKVTKKTLGEVGQRATSALTQASQALSLAQAGRGN